MSAHAHGSFPLNVRSAWFALIVGGKIALVCALVQFHLLGTAEPRLGIVFFGLVVVLTMCAAMSFDPRLIWDGEEG